MESTLVGKNDAFSSKGIKETPNSKNPKFQFWSKDTQGV